MSLIDKLKGVPSEEFMAQGGHFLLGLSAVALPGWIWGDRAALYGTAAIAVYALVKEIVWDPIMEEDNAFFWVGVKDCAFFALGVGTSWGLHRLL